MNVQDLIKQCRYYNGEKECPESIANTEHGQLWLYERVWVDFSSNQTEIIDNYVEEYKAFPELATIGTEDETPLSLKALLFDRYAEGSWSKKSAVEGFKLWYNEFYKGSN